MDWKRCATPWTSQGAAHPSGRDPMRAEPLTLLNKPERGQPPKGSEPSTTTEQEIPLDHVFLPCRDRRSRLPCCLGVLRQVRRLAERWACRDRDVDPGSSTLRGAFNHLARAPLRRGRNSEEGDQVLRRFSMVIFEVEVELRHAVRPVLPKMMRCSGTWICSCAGRVRGRARAVHRPDHRPISIELPRILRTLRQPGAVADHVPVQPERPVDAFGDPLPTLRQALRLRLISVREKGGIFGFFDHLEQTADFEDTLIVDIAPGDGTVDQKAWAIWNSQLGGAIRDYDATERTPIPDSEPELGRWRGEVPMPRVAHSLLGPDAVLAITVTPR